MGRTKDYGNLLDLLRERLGDVPALKRWMAKRDKWVNGDVQNELAEIMAQAIQQGPARSMASLLTGQLMQLSRNSLPSAYGGLTARR